MKRLLATLVLLLAMATNAWAWGRSGHTLVADVAAAGLGANARAKVASILGPKSMADVAVWADLMRDWQRDRPHRPPGLANDAEATAFFNDRKNDNQPNWHFVDLPLGVTTYQLNQTGTRSDDVVQIIRRCIAKLKGMPLPQENISEGQALRLLVHFVGDLHQPFHAGAGYWIPGSGGTAVLAQPAQAKNGVEDRGGNELKIGSGGSSLHSFWDNDMVTAGQAGRTRAEYLRALVQLAGGPGGVPWKGTGDPMDWPARWAGESAKAADTAFQSVTGVSVKITGSGAGRKVKGSITIPNNYKSNFTTTVNTQLARGGLHLAQVLNAIWP